MTALTKSRKTSNIDPGSVIPRLQSFPVAAAAKGYSAGMVGVDAAGNASPASAIATLKIAGVAAIDYDNTTGAAAAFQVPVEIGAFLMENGAGSDALSAADYLEPCYVVDDATVARDDGGGTRPVAGLFLGLDPVHAKPIVVFGLPPSALVGSAGAASSPSNFARVVATSLQAYGGTGTDLLTESANGAFATQDGVATMAIGDEIFLPPGLANVTLADVGPWVLLGLGGASSKWSMARPAWWKTGGGIPQGRVIQIGGEGTNHRGMSIKTFCGKGKIIGTDDPKFVPAKQTFRFALSSGTYTIGAGGGNELLWLYDTTKCAVQLTSDTHAGTIGTAKLEAPSGSRVAGYPNTAAIVVNSIVDAGTVAAGDTSTVDATVESW